MKQPPVGTVTFLFTDIEGSTKLWHKFPDAMPQSFNRHNMLLNESITAHGGYVFQIIGDAFCAAFSTAYDGLEAALDAQRALDAEEWGDTGAIRVRMALHTGIAEVQAGEYTSGEYISGLTMSHAARLLSSGHGGQILLSLAAAELVRDHLPQDVSLRDLGTYRLKDLARPERIYQVVTANLQQDFPHLKTFDSYPNNLPEQMTSFVGREREIVAVVDLLKKHRLVMLTGSGGVGKTRLALEVTSQVLGDYPDGVWYIELAPLTEPGLVANWVAYTLGLRDSASISMLDALTFFLNNQQALLMLDNCEHLLAACASLANHLLVHCPKIHILASSREALGVSGEIAFRVPSLSVPDRQGPARLEILAAYEAVRLFVDRGQLSLPGFRLTTDNAQAIAQVCQRLDGIPLAIELAAARLGVLSVAQIASRLDDAFRLLTGGSRSALPRQQTLRATIDWSFRLLNKRESRLFRRLAVFAGGWTLQAAEAICSGQGIKSGETLDLLSSMAGKSLVIAERKQGEETRFRFLETVRQFAGEKLFDEQESIAFHTRHRDYFLRLAEVADTKYECEARLEWTRQIKLELDNLRLALEWSFHDCADVEAGLHLAVAVKEWWQSLGFLQESCDWLLSGLEICGSQPIPPLLRARSQITLGGSLWLMGDFAEARRWLEIGVAACREIGDEANADLCEALYKLAMSNTDQPDNLVLARSLLDESVEVGRKLDSAERYNLAWALGFRAWLSIFIMNEPLRARQDARESYNLACQVGCHWDCAGPLLVLAWLAHEGGESQKARQQFQDALALFEAAEDRYGIFQANLVIGGFYFDLGDFYHSGQHYREALRSWNYIGSHSPMSISFLAYFGTLEILRSKRCSAAKRIEHLRKSAFLLGAVEKLSGGFYFFDRTFTYADYIQDLEFLQSQFSEARVARAWSEGQSISLDQAWKYLLESYG